MAMTVKQVCKRLEAHGVKTWADPGEQKLLLVWSGTRRTYHAELHLQLGGRFIQFRCRLVFVPDDHAHLSVVLSVLAAVNYNMRFIKAARDPRDGEVVVMGDAWLSDGQLTAGQLREMVSRQLCGRNGRRLAASGAGCHHR